MKDDIDLIIFSKCINTNCVNFEIYLCPKEIKTNFFSAEVTSNTTYEQMVPKHDDFTLVSVRYIIIRRGLNHLDYCLPSSSNSYHLLHTSCVLGVVQPLVVNRTSKGYYDENERRYSS